MRRPHLYFKNPTEGPERYAPPTRDTRSREPQEDEPTKDYTPMKEDFESSLRSFFAQKSDRDNRRNRGLTIPATVDYIRFEFFDSFNSSYETHYRRYFGLAPIRYEEFNSVGFFAVADEALFSHFVRNLQTFIRLENPGHSEEYDRHIRYIKRFSFHSSDKIKRYQREERLIILDLFDSLELSTNKIKPIVDSLKAYLDGRNVQSSIDTVLGRIELENPGETILQEIVDNFDVIHSANSPLAGLVSPSPYNVPVRGYGFQIDGATDNLPIIGIIDTGISDQTPLAPLIVNANSDYDITGSNPRIDNADHGTGVAAIAALGRSFYANHQGVFKADARLLSIKVLDSAYGQISEAKVLGLIRKANRELGIRIFVLSIGYEERLADNANISNYARSLDVIANELNLLIFIAGGNVRNLLSYVDPRFSGRPEIRYPNHYESPDFNLCAPGDSMNNLTCGAISDNMEPVSTDVDAYSLDRSFPASYTRKFNLNRAHSSYRPTRVSKHLFKPDCSTCGGDYDSSIGAGQTGIKVLSADFGKFFERSVGTSYSTPMIANVAAKILRIYPELSDNMQTVKALIINSCSIPATGELFQGLAHGMRLSDFLGHGTPDQDRALYSDDNTITFILEDSIRPEEIKAYPIRFPEYLSGLEHKRGVVEVNATICFKFSPLPHNHLVYCPIHMAFGIFKNVPLSRLQMVDGNEAQTGINGGTAPYYVFRESWSEDYYFKVKLLSNAQKVRFNIQKSDLLNERNEFKIAVHSKLHKLLHQSPRDSYDAPQSFSLVFSFREIAIHNQLSNELYNEMVAVNELQAIADLEAQLEV